MTPLAALAVDEFAVFFRAVHGVPPFPWQTRLAARAATGDWPRMLDLPTGSGKTAAIDVALFALALSAGTRPRTAPLRIVYVVDRRTVVDQAFERACRIQCALETSPDDVVRRVRERLASFAPVDGVPLRTALLRGGIARDDEWARTPDQPLIAVSTVDQVGSRLLFRGYGISPGMRPIHAGLLGNDVIYLLDEVHLSHPFRETLDAIASRYRQWADRPLPLPFQVVEMSATPGRVSDDAFQLLDDDRRHPTLASRLETSKLAELVAVPPKNLPREIVERAIGMLDRPGATVAVVVNRVSSARKVHQALRQKLGGREVDVHLLTGRMRPFDRGELEGSLLARIRADRERRETDRPVIVVATQTIEAGADFDFDDLVTECASLDALRQRFGRLDRLGTLAGRARGVIVAPAKLERDPVYGDAAARTWHWLEGQADGNGRVDFGIEAMRVPEDAQHLLTPLACAPVLLPSHLDAWAQTNPAPTPDPDVALWLHGPERGIADVQIVWRADLTQELLEAALQDRETDAESGWAQLAIDAVDALPPVSAEAMAVPFQAARRWLEGLPERDAFDVEGASDGDEDEGRPTARDRERLRPPRPALVWQGEGSRVVRANEIRPGQTLVVPAIYGGIANANWAPESDTPVRDIAEYAVLQQRPRPVLRLHPDVARGLLGEGVRIPVPPTSEEEAVSDRDQVLAWLDEVRPADGERLAGLFDRLRQSGKKLQVARLPLVRWRRNGPARILEPEEELEYFVVTGTRQRATKETADERATADDISSSFTGAGVTLSGHQAGVAALAAGFAERLGLPQDLVSDLRLAAEWHDAGKADVRFQRWLHGGSEFKVLVQPEPIAKGTARLSRRALRLARERAGYPAGGRHELTSLALVEAAGAQLAGCVTDLALIKHLVASHHGWCRALAPWVPDPNPVDILYAGNGISCTTSSAHGLERLDSGVTERFWELARRHGWWGLAWLEAVLRLADFRQSEREQEGRS